VRTGVGLRARVTFFFGFGALLLSTILATLTYELTRSYLLRQREQSVTRQAFVNAGSVRRSLLASGTDLPTLLTTLDTQGDSHPVLLNRGRWFAETLAFGRDALPAELRDVVAGGEAAKQRFDRRGAPQLAVGVPLLTVEAAYFEIFPLQEVERGLTALRNSLIAAAFVTTLGGIAVGRWASRRLLRPVAAVSRAAAAIAGGRYDVRLEGAGDPDLDALATSFNQMTQALVARIEREARFASSVSHELRSPLTTLAAAAQVLESRRRDLPERSRAALDLLTAEIRRFQRLVEDLLEISRIDAGVADVRREPVHVAEFVMRAVRGATTADVPIEVAAEAGETVVEADKRRLERVVANLVANAEYYGGGVTRVSVEDSGATVRVAVEDSGPGVPEAERERIFERFARGGAAGRRRSGEGTGLGLSLVAEHVRLHDGRVWVEDRSGGGARFVVELPVDGHA
jgi:two-component system, OmpR family, sensor histidine kinase MtrB